ncbi:hypothetical protein Tco_1320428 [Tanacetum coccineum]
MKESTKYVDWGKVKITDEVMEYNTLYKVKAQEDKETKVAKESKDIAFSIMKEHDEGKAKQVEHDLDDVDLVDALDLENIIKKLEEDFSRAPDDPNAPPPSAPRKRKP